jgi:hypothetical protein
MGKPVIEHFKKLTGIGFSPVENPPLPPPIWDASVVDENTFNGNSMLRSSVSGESGDDRRNGDEIRPRSVNDLPPLDESSVRRVGEVSGREVSGRVLRRRYLLQQRRFVGRSVLSPLMDPPQFGQEFGTLRSSSVHYPETGMSQSMKGPDRTPLDALNEGSQSTKETGWGMGKTRLSPVEDVSQREGYIDTAQINNRGRRGDIGDSNENDDEAGEYDKGGADPNQTQFQTMDSVWSHETHDKDIDEERVMR